MSGLLRHGLPSSHPPPADPSAVLEASPGGYTEGVLGAAADPWRGRLRNWFIDWRIPILYTAVGALAMSVLTGLAQRPASIPEVTLDPVMARAPAAHDSALIAGLIPLVGGPVVGLTVPETIALVEHLARVEGYEAHAYQDQGGVLTIGIGSNIENGPGIPRVAALAWALNSVKGSCSGFAKGWPDYMDEPAPLKAGLCDFSYQLGTGGALGFHDTLAALAAGRCDDAIAGIRASDWWDETESRAAHLAGLVERYGCEGAQ